jgi:hypothetical protein
MSFFLLRRGQKVEICINRWGDLVHKARRDADDVLDLVPTIDQDHGLEMYGVEMKRDTGVLRAEIGDFIGTE